MDEVKEIKRIIKGLGLEHTDLCELTKKKFNSCVDLQDGFRAIEL